MRGGGGGLRKWLGLGGGSVALSRGYMEILSKFTKSAEHPSKRPTRPLVQTPFTNLDIGIPGLQSRWPLWVEVWTSVASWVMGPQCICQESGPIFLKKLRYHIPQISQVMILVKLGL